jgi:hypothetical protein
MANLCDKIGSFFYDVSLWWYELADKIHRRKQNEVAKE